MKRHTKRGVSLGTITMLTLTCLVLTGFFALLPRITGKQDLSLNASELAVVLDKSIEQLSEAGRAVAANRSAGQAAPKAQAAQTAAFGQTQQTTANGQAQQTAVSAAALPEATATPVPVLSFTLCAGGSLKFNSAVQKSCTDDAGYHFEALLEPLKDSLNADLTIATLENRSISTDKLSNANVPAELLTALRTSGIDALCLGYFGILDDGVEGLRATMEGVQAAGMQPYGAYSAQQERDALTLVQANGVSVALLSYQSGMNAAGKKATNAEEQAYAIAGIQLPVIQQDIQAVRARGAQVVVVSLCWGKTGATAPTDTQKELAQGIADAGADIILGTHSEAVQSVRILTAQRGDGKYHPVLCAYNLGNLFTYNREKRVSLAGALLHASVVYDSSTQTVAFDSLTYTPTYCWRGKVDGVQQYRVLNSARAPAPEYAVKEQQNVMDKCLSIITDAMEGGGFAME